MDGKGLITSFRSLNPLNLVVSTEPLDVANVLASSLGKYVGWGMVRVATQQGIIDVKSYLEGESLKGYKAPKEALKTDGDVIGEAANEPTKPKVWGAAEKNLDTAWRSDPKNEQFFYLFPDIWPVLSDPKILASVQRLRDERQADPRSIKMYTFIVPTLDIIPEAFRSMFDIHYDTGLTVEQAREELGGDKGILKMLEVTVTPEHLEEMVKQSTGLTTSEVARASAFAVVTQRPVSVRTKTLTPVGFAEWRAAHGKPAV